MPTVLPADVMTNPALWVSQGDPHANPAPAPVLGTTTRELRFDLSAWAPANNPDASAFYGVGVTGLTVGTTYQLRLVVDGVDGEWRASIAGETASPWNRFNNAIEHETVDWTASAADATVGIEVKPDVDGMWADLNPFSVVNITMHDVADLPPPLSGTISCEPNLALGYPAMWIEGNAIRGYSVVKLERVMMSGERHEVRGSAGIKFINDRSYREVRDFEPDAMTPLTPPTYERARQAYTPQEYRTWLYVDSPTRKFSVTDIEAPYQYEFHYELTVQMDPDDPDDTQVYKSSPCSFTHQPQEFFSPVPCSPIILTDPLTMEQGQWVGLLSIDPLSYPGRRELYDVIGRHTPVAYGQVRQTARTTIRVITGIMPNNIPTPQAVQRALRERQNFLDLLWPGRILLLRNPDTRYPENNWYLSIGEVTEERIFTDHRRPERRFVLEVAVVDRPSGYLDIVGGGHRTFDIARDFLPDGKTDAPADYTFESWRKEYRNFSDIEIGHEYFVPHATGLVDRPLVYGEGIYPTRQAALTSWSLV